MPIKCMAQMPTPMAKPPPSSQTSATRPVEEATRPAISSAVNEASIATSIETITVNASYEVTNIVISHIKKLC